MGLRATGSDSYGVSDLFVDHAHTVVRDEPAERRQPGLLYCFPTGSMYASGFAGVALGIARRMLDALVALAQEKTPRGFKTTLRESAVVQSQTAQAEARLGSARAYLLTSLEEIWREVGRSPALGLAERVRIRLAATYAIHQAMAVADWAYHTAGATAIFESHAFERRFRDIHAVSQQVQGRHAHYETVGRFLFGLDPSSPYL
jgi:alkylation response protein AidB-like acyl-CoA dehydrogenase